MVTKGQIDFATAHPRWRGEDDTGLKQTTSTGGSSPLARGGRVDLGDQPDEQRLIPAGAGRTP